MGHTENNEYIRKGWLNFTFSGTDYQSYFIKRYCVEVKLITIHNNPPIITFYNIINSTAPGQQDFIV